MNKQNEETVRPLAFQLARELNEKEVEAIAGGNMGWTWHPGAKRPEPEHHH